MSTLPMNASLSSFFSAGVHPFVEQSRIEKKATVLKHIARSERLIAVRPASQLEVRPRPEMLSTGIAEIDAMAGGLPRGCLTEICGPPSSGKSSVLLATIAAATRREESCVLIDASDGFDPSSGEAAGLDFHKLLWVRCGGFLCDEASPEQSRRDSSVRQKNANHRGHPLTSLRAGFVAQRQITQRRNRVSERKLDQVLKAADLVLQSGGFGLVALDLAGIPEKFVGRIPPASWFRFQRAVEYTKTALLVVSEVPCAQTCATLVVKVYSKLSAISSQLSAKPTHTEVFKDMQVDAEILRSRLERKPMQSVRSSFLTQAVRAG